MPVLMFLAKYWKYIASILLILIVFGYWKSLTSTIARQEAAIIQYKVNEKIQEANLATCTNANDKFSDLIEAINATNLQLSDLNTKMNASLVDLTNRIKRQAEEIKKKEALLANVPWDKLNCPEQVDACYEILRSTP
jgi:hypothetical protein